MVRGFDGGHGGGENRTLHPARSASGLVVQFTVIVNANVLETDLIPDGEDGLNVTKAV